MSGCLEIVLPAILALNPTWSTSKAEKYAKPICVESKKRGIDPLIGVALIQHETGFRNKIHKNKNGSYDYGPMQFNCGNDIRMSWRKRLCAKKNRHRLLSIKGNIYAGFKELSFWERNCLKKHGDKTCLFNVSLTGKHLCLPVALVPRIIRRLFFKKRLTNVLFSHWWLKHYNWNSKTHWLSVLYVYRVLLVGNARYYGLVRTNYYRRFAKNGTIRKCIIEPDLCVGEYEKWRQRKTNSKRRSNH